MPYSIGSANLSIVSIVDKSANNAIPSKMFNYLSVGSPVLGISPHESDLAELIRNENIGKNFETNESNKIADFIIDMWNDAAMSNNYSRQALKVSKKYTSAIANNFV